MWIDSGARITSLHALNVKLEEYKRNISRLISFDTLNEKGVLKHMQARATNEVRVRNAQGVEYRYVIRLGLRYKNIIKYKEVNLRDRSNMSYKLLIGRNWLNDDFVIKTDKALIKK